MKANKVKQGVVAPKERDRLVQALANLPDEAFGWFVVWAARADARYPTAFHFPDGLGGFTSDSKVGITSLQAAAAAYIAAVTKSEQQP